MPEFDLDAALTDPDPDGLAWSGAARWLRSDSNKACRAGWDIFSSDCEAGTELQLQALNHDYEHVAPFGGDDGRAFKHVWAERGSDPLCAKALFILRRDSRAEFDRIKAFAEWPS